jgi:hypothetical protein
MKQPTFEMLAGAQKLVAWFRAQGFEEISSAPRADNDWAVETFSTREGLDGFPIKLNAPDAAYPSEDTFDLAEAMLDGTVGEDDGLEIPDSDYIESEGYWWDAKGWRPTDEELAADDQAYRDLTEETG